MLGASKYDKLPPPFKKKIGRKIIPPLWISGRMTIAIRTLPCEASGDTAVDFLTSNTLQGSTKILVKI